MTTIAENTGRVTAINVFTVDPSNQQRLIELLTRATETSVRDAPGFVSAALHRSVDGTKVTMYAQWQSAEHYQRYQATRSETGASYVAQILAIAKFDPGTYDVVRIFAGRS
ncbi:MAG TPA: antibiotic biosynthesis monooxygenase family protein [Burkholderiaceae bacterium]